MPAFDVTSPDGKKYRVNAPEGATHDQALDYAKSKVSAPLSAPAASKPESVVADVGKTLAAGAGQTALSIPMVIPALMNQAAEGPQMLYRGLTGREHDNSPYIHPFVGPQDIISYEPKTTAGQVAGNIESMVTPLIGARGASSKIAGEMGNSAIENVRKSGILTDTSSKGEPIGQVVGHSIQTAGKVVDTALSVSGNVLKPIVKPTVRGILESDNSVFGGGIKTALASKEAKEAGALGEKMGVNFSVGELTGNPTARNIEDALANSAKWSRKFTEANQAKTDAIVGKFKETLGGISSESTSTAGLGEKLTASYKKTIDSLVNARRAQASVDFAHAEHATGGQPVIAPTNFIKVLSDYVKEGESDLATPAQKAASSQAKEMLGDLTIKPPKPSVILDASGRPITRPVQPQYKKITVRDLQNGLAGFGDAGKSNGGLWKSLDTASDRRFAKAAKNALESDLDASADSGAGEGTFALKKARDNYKAISTKIGDIQQTALGKIVGGAERDSKGNLVIFPEKMAERFSKMDATEIKSTLKFLDQEHPDVAKMARRYTLESAYKKATEGIGQRGAGATKNFGKVDFVKALPDDEKLAAILGNTDAAKEVKDVATAMNRMIDYGASKSGSPTAQRTDILGRLQQWGVKKIWQTVVDDTLAEDFLNSKKFISQVAKPPTEFDNTLQKLGQP